MEEYRMLSNEELKKIRAEFEEKYQEQQKIFKNAYESMIKLSSEYNIVNDIIEQREGRTNKTKKVTEDAQD